MNKKAIILLSLTAVVGIGAFAFNKFYGAKQNVEPLMEQQAEVQPEGTAEAQSGEPVAPSPESSDPASDATTTTPVQD